MSTTVSVHEAAYACLMEPDVAQKLLRAEMLYQQFVPLDQLPREASDTVVSVEMPGKPDKPELVAPRAVKSRKLSSEIGRATLVHAVAHIEFNAINLALDAVYRFRDMPDQYYRDWLLVAREEARHFGLLQARLKTMGYTYGDMTAHNGLWEMAVKTDHDVLTRMALVPRVMEARGLDVTPGMIQRLEQVGDAATVEILHVILAEEIGHVAIGSRWFKYCCELQGLPPESTFLELLEAYMGRGLRGPFHTEARLQAGFSEAEMQQLEKLA